MQPEHNWLSALISPPFLAALVGALINLYTGTQVKRQADKFSAQFSGTYKIQEQLAGEFLANSYKARRILSKYGAFHVNDKNILVEETLELGRLLDEIILTQSKSRIYFSTVIHEEMGQVIINLQAAQMFIFQLNAGVSFIEYLSNKSKGRDLIDGAIAREKELCDLFRDVLVAPSTNEKSSVFKLPKIKPPKS